MRRFRRNRAAGKRRVGIAVGVVAALLAVAAPSAQADSNDTIAGASGPILNGVTWEGAIQTENDVDWFVFYSGASTETDIALMSTGPDDCFGQVMKLTDANGKFLAEYGYPINRNETEHILYTVGPGTFYVEVSPYNVAPCIGSSASYRLWINSSPALLASPPYIPPAVMTPASSSPPEVSSSCRRARQRVANLRSHLRKARSPGRRASLRSALRRARASAAGLC